MKARLFKLTALIKKDLQFKKASKSRFGERGANDDKTKRFTI